MKKIYLLVVFFSILFVGTAQNIAITDDDTYPAESSAMLDVKSTTKGMLVPRLTTTQRNAVSSPATGLLVFDTTEDSFYFYNGSQWINLTSGNASGVLGYTAPDKVYLTDVNDKFGIGTTSPMNKLDVKADSDNGIDQAIFNVVNQDGDTIFAVYPYGVRINVLDDTTQLRATTTKGGFAVGGYNREVRGVTNEYLRVTPDSVRIYIEEGDLSRASTTKGGFAVGGYNRGVRGAVVDDYFNIYGSNNASKINSDARIFWYPLKEAFLAGRVLVEAPDSVGTNSIAVGFEPRALGNYSQAFGYQSYARGDYSFSIGYMSGAESNYSFAAGFWARAIGAYSTAMGFNTIASGSNSCAFGYLTNATGSSSFSMGDRTIASGIGSAAFGIQQQATGSASFAAGSYGVASGGQAVAFGRGTTASGNYSVAVNYSTTANTDAAFASGWATTASGNSSFAANFATQASGMRSFATGWSTIASGQASATFNGSTTASGTYTTAMGQNSTAQSYASLVIGRYNVIEGTTTSWVDTEPLFVAGNGASSAARSNALTLYKNGNLDLAGSITQDSWTAPTLLNSWVNFSSEYNSVGYFRDKNGIVHLRGVVKSGTAANAIIFTLPTGYRPSNREIHTSYSSNGACRVDIDSSGNIWVSSNGSTSWTSLDGITFRASGY